MTLFLQKKFSGHLTWLWIFFRKQRFVRLSLKEPGERKLSQEEIADKLTKWTKQYPNAKTSVTQQPTIRGQQTWWFTDTIHYSNSKF
jgi:hypothetical protein